MPKFTRHEQIRLKYRKERYHEGRTALDTIGDLLNQTCDLDPKIRNKAVQKLCPCHVQTNLPAVWDRLLAMTTDPDPKVRATILHTLADGSPREREAEIVQAIKRMVHDPNPKLRRRVRKLLAQYRRTGKINVL